MQSGNGYGILHMTNHSAEHSPAWYFGTREEFLKTPQNEIANKLAGRAAAESLQIELAQSQEWNRSIGLLQKSLDERIPILLDALKSPGCEAIRHVILEFDFRRRGLRIDCLLLADGVLFVIEFKRSQLGRAERDQVMNYAVNLLEFHNVTREWCEKGKAIVVPVLALTVGSTSMPVHWPELAGHSWPALAHKPMECDKNTLHEALRLGLKNRRSSTCVSHSDWLKSPFRPSSSILDAVLSLYGNHDVVSIQEHAASREAINASAREIREHIDQALERGAYHIIFLSGAPGAGKTLVGLDLVMRGKHAQESVFVTGNAPLVEVLNQALSSSYRAQRATSWASTGYLHSDAKLVTSASNFKIVKAHNFLGNRGQAHHQVDSRILVFDEAQRTYEKGRMVLGKSLEDHEATLILSVQRKTFPEGGAVVVALIGHNQAINRGERGIIAWLEAAVSSGWSFSIADETLQLAELQEKGEWAKHPSRKQLKNGHLRQSMRYYRNTAVEEWVDAILKGDTPRASSIAAGLKEHNNTIWLTRNLAAARQWAKSQAVGGHRAGLIASAQARRLAAEGLFVDYKPDIATWMLAPSSDLRSSNALETVQNQYQIQGLELDFCIVCWDADFRREGNEWVAYKLSGDDWQKDRLVDVAKNCYRVLLTRARKGMIVFVPIGDLSGEDQTRKVAFYNNIWEFLKACGAQELES